MIGEPLAQIDAREMRRYAMRLKDAPQPFQYQGSKRLIAPVVLDRLCLTRDQVLVEPFAGSAAVSVRAALERRAAGFWLNDANEPLVALWQQIVDNPDDLVAKYAELWDDQLRDPKGFYVQVRARFNKSPNPADMLYLLARAVKGAVRYNAVGEFNQSPDNRRLGTKPCTLAKRLRLISAAMKNRTVFTSFDYRCLPEHFEPGQVWYMDPPYEGVSTQRDSRYIGPVCRQAFEEFLERLVMADIPFVLSYDGQTGSRTYGSPLPAALGLERLEIDAGRSTSATLLGKAERTTEVLYVSPALQGSVSLHGRQSEQLAIDLTPTLECRN